MELIRLGLVHPSRRERDARLALLGVEELLAQEGIPYRAVAAEAESRSAGVNLLLALDHGCFTAVEERGLARLAGDLPLVWTGIPRRDAAPELLRVLGLEEVRVDTAGTLRLVRLVRHPLALPFVHPNERTLRMKFVEHLVAACPPNSATVADVALADGTSFGPALYLTEGTPRRAVFTIPIGEVYAQKTSRYTDGEHLDQNDFPICTIVDVLRGLLRETLRWAAGDAILARTHYWPMRGAIPRGLFSTTHDLCGYSEAGVRYIRRICESEGIRTTFFDLHPFRLARGEAGAHDVCLHASDATGFDDIVAQKKELEDRQGITVRGWRRHGCTAKEHHPRIWRDVVRAGIVWSSTHNVQTHPFMGAAYHVATSNRLPGHVMDLDRGERIPLLEIPCFDSGEDDRLSNFGYGPKLTQEEFFATVETRISYAARHNLMAGYLLHGWTAGVERETKPSELGALDGKRMLPYAIAAAKAHGMTFLSCEELYDWWMHRRAARLDVGVDRLTVEPPAGPWTLVLELDAPPNVRLGLEVDGRAATPEVWSEPGRGRWLVPVAGACTVRVRAVSRGG